MPWAAFRRALSPWLRTQQALLPRVSVQPGQYAVGAPALSQHTVGVRGELGPKCVVGTSLNARGTLSPAILRAQLKPGLGRCLDAFPQPDAAQGSSPSSELTEGALSQQGPLDFVSSPICIRMDAWISVVLLGCTFFLHLLLLIFVLRVSGCSWWLPFAGLRSPACPTAL